MVADREVDPLNEGGVDVPTLWGQNLFDTSQCAKDHAMVHLNQPSAPVFLDDLRIEEPGQRRPAGLRGRAFGLSARWLDPVPKVGQQRRRILLEAVGDEQR